MRKGGLLKIVLGLSLVVVLAMSIPLVSGCTGAEPSPEPEPTTGPEPEPEPEQKYVDIGFLCALSGPEAGWGLPGITGVKIWMDEVNSKGGLDVGGEKYMIRLHTYDDESISSKALLGAKELVLEHDVKFVNTIGGGPTDACAPFFEEHGVFYAPLMQDTKPDRPHCILAEANSKGDPLRAVWISQAYPEAKTVAIATQDDPIGRITNAWEIGAYNAEGIDVVYEEYYSLDTVDFAPIVTAMLDKDPDILSWGCSYPTFDAALYEQAYLQGFEGVICSNYIDLEATLAKVPAEWLVDRAAIDGYPSMDDPWWGEPSKQHEFYDKWMARFGPGAPEDVGRDICSIDWDHVVSTEPWAYGCELAGTFEGDAVLEAMRSADSLPTILGPAIMWGEEQFGIANQILPNLYINEIEMVDGEAKRRIVAEYDWAEYWEANSDTLIEAAEERGVMYYQRD